MPRLIDISPAIDEGIAVFPGDVPYRRSVSLDMEKGDNLTLGSLSSTLHLGAHADAPNHYHKGAVGIDACALETYYGECQVVTVRIAPGARISVQDLPAPIVAARVLLNTGSFPSPNTWNDDFNSLEPDLVSHLADHGVILIGIDTPSIDPAADRALLAHTAVATRGLAVLEGLTLSHVPDGVYTLIALPLKLRGADASPVRAVLAAST